jgi:signal peptidase II
MIGRKMREKNKKSILIYSGILTLTLIDILTKYLFTNKNYFNEFLISINYTTNKGSSFGIFSELSFYNYFMVILSILVLVLILLNIKKIKKLIFKNKYYQISFILFLSGFLGNLYDRLIFGYVRDFISLTLFVFNLADFYLTICICLVFYNELVKNRFITNK